MVSLLAIPSRKERQLIEVDEVDVHKSTATLPLSLSNP